MAGGFTIKQNPQIIFDLGPDTIIPCGDSILLSSGTISGGGSAFDNNGTDPTTSFEHNNGTVTIDGGNTALRGGTGSSTTTGTIFYNLTQAGSGYVDSYEYYKVINKINLLHLIFT